MGRVGFTTIQKKLARNRVIMAIIAPYRVIMAIIAPYRAILTW